MQKFIPSSLGINAYGTEKKTGLGRGRSWAVMQSQQGPQSNLQGALELGWTFGVEANDVILITLPQSTRVCGPMQSCIFISGNFFGLLLFNQSLDVGCPQKGCVTLRWLFGWRQFLDRNSAESWQPTTLLATGTVSALNLEGRIWAAHSQQSLPIYT